MLFISQIYFIAYKSLSMYNNMGYNLNSGIKPALTKRSITLVCRLESNVMTSAAKIKKIYTRKCQDRLTEVWRTMQIDCDKLL